MTFIHWKKYFESNAVHFDWFEEQEIAYFTAEEIQRLTKTIQTFQKGENSEGKNLIKYAKASGNPEYLEAIKYFIREEQKHALVLGKLMSHNEIPKIKHHWTDTVFRSLRNLAGLQMSVVVLLTAEIIAAVFYRALNDASKNQTLKNICDRILIDEEMHINFQCFTLHEIRKNQSKLQRRMTQTFHRVLMEGTLWVVYFDHRNVLNAGGYDLKKWRNAVLLEFNRASEMISGSDIELRHTLPKTYSNRKGPMVVSQKFVGA